ncbi:hypothetical protein F5146DRAFT_1175176 [Armillaria mellea]|nr:hypothetical protein F5146DRAFT_1175176 [Armillaria mellea]
MSSFFQNCDSTSSSSNGEHCVINVARLVGVIIGFVILAIIFAIAKCHRRRSPTNNSILAQVPGPAPAPASWPSPQLIPPPPPPVYAYQQPAIYPNNAFPPPLAGPVQSNNQYHITVSPPASPDVRRTSGSWSTVGDFSRATPGHRPHPQPVVQPNNAFPSPAPVRSGNRFHKHPQFTRTVSPPAPEASSTSSEARGTSFQPLAGDPHNSHGIGHHSRQQPVVQSDDTYPIPAPLQSNNPFRRYLVDETVSPPASSEAQRVTSQADDPYDAYAVARRQQAVALARYSRTSSQLSESATSSSEPRPPPYTE